MIDDWRLMIYSFREGIEGVRHKAQGKQPITSTFDFGVKRDEC